MEEEPRYFVRFKGRVTGPFELNEVRSGFHSGRITRAHGISTDRVRWVAAGSHPDLVERHAASSPESALEVEPAPAVKPAATARAAGYVSWICPGCGCDLTMESSASGEVVHCPTCGGESQVPNPTEARAPDAGILATDEDVGAAVLRESPLDQTNRVLGVGIGISAIVMANLPIAVSEDVSVFWWDLFREGGARMATFVVLGLAAAIALTVVSAVAKGVPRAAVFVAISSITIWAFAVVAGTWQVSALGMLFVAAAVLLGIATWQRFHAAGSGPRTALAIAGGVTFLLWLVLLLICLGDSRLDDLEFQEGRVVVAFVLSVLGLVAGSTAGLLGVISLRRDYSNGLNRAIRMLSPLSCLLPVVGLLLLAGVLNLWATDNDFLRHTGAWVVLFVLRVLLLLASLFLLLSFGLAEWLLSARSPVRGSL